MKTIATKILLTAVLVTGASSCSKQLQIEDIQTQRDATEKTYLEFVLPSVIKNAATNYQDRAFDDLLLPCVAMYYSTLSGETQNTYLDFYQVRNEWDGFYSQLKLVKAGVDLAQQDQNPAYQGIFLIFESFLFGISTDLYGPAIYSQAMQGRDGIVYPEYDSEEMIYKGILDKLKEANSLIASSALPISANGDILYGGDLKKWQKFANSLRLRYLMRISAKLPDVAKAGFAEILGNPTEYPIFDAAADNAGLKFPGTTVDNSWSGGPLDMSDRDFANRKPTRMLVDTLRNNNDPRMGVWLAPAQKPWTTDPAKDGVKETVQTPNGYSYEITWEYLKPEFDQQYVVNKDSYWTGMLPGSSSSSRLRQDNGNYDVAAADNYKVSSFSKLFHENTNALLRATIMNGDEAYFILAEAAEKGLASGDAATYYNKAIDLSMARWGITDKTAIDAFKARVALPATSAERLAKIAGQKWLALLFISTETFVDVRRTGLPDYSKVVADRKIPIRFRYPFSESGQNAPNYAKAVSMLSPANDTEYSKVWLLQ